MSCGIFLGMFLLTYILSLKVWNLLEHIFLNYDYLIENYHPRDVFCPYFCFVDPPQSIMSISAIRNKWYVNEIMTYFIWISLHVRMFSGIKGVGFEKEDFRDCVVSNYTGVCSSKSTVNDLYSHWITIDRS